MNADAFEWMLRKYGQSAVYHTQGGETLPLKAFIQPIVYKNRQYLGDSITPVGQRDAGRYMYFGPGSVAMDEDGWLESGGRAYKICRSERIRLGDGLHHTRAVLMLRGEDYGDS